MNYIVKNKPLPNGPKKQVPKRIILHAMGEYIVFDSGEKKHAYDFLKSIGLSVHALICPDGTVIRCREDTQGAWHAKGHNKDSLGVEFLVEGNYNYASFIKAIKKPYITFEQHVAGVELVRDWCSTYGITSIEEHRALSPKRKYDLGRGFPLKQFLIDVKAGV
ncbi:N-acetylmuramoyl-L-alanine amidase [Candidatus Pacearchaeota archaeon]|nr:N-acetylmuramoyl-L-alanine amidase [Candidatus Pacearchaeota archaeon]